MVRGLYPRALWWCLTLSLPLSATAEPIFHLCAHNVDAWQQQQGQLYIRLSAEGREELADITGERLKIHVGEMALDHAFIHTPIESGQLVLSWPYRHRMQSLPDSPCGSPR